MHEGVVIVPPLTYKTRAARDVLTVGFLYPQSGGHARPHGWGTGTQVANMSIVLKHLLNPILADDGLTRGLGDEEACLLVHWLVERTELLAGSTAPEHLPAGVLRLCRHGRAIARFVWLWSLCDDWAAATQLAASERFTWPLPNVALDPYDLMQLILTWESAAPI